MRPSAFESICYNLSCEKKCFINRTTSAFSYFSFHHIFRINISHGFRTTTPEENCPLTPKLTQTLTPPVTLTAGRE